jgi:hypothetical protein
MYSQINYGISWPPLLRYAKHDQNIVKYPGVHAFAELLWLTQEGHVHKCLATCKLAQLENQNIHVILIDSDWLGLILELTNLANLSEYGPRTGFWMYCTNGFQSHAITQMTQYYLNTLPSVVLPFWLRAVNHEDIQFCTSASHNETWMNCLELTAQNQNSSYWPPTNVFCELLMWVHMINKMAVTMQYRKY